MQSLRTDGAGDDEVFLDETDAGVSSDTDLGVEAGAETEDTGVDGRSPGTGLAGFCDCVMMVNNCSRWCDSMLSKWARACNCTGVNVILIILIISSLISVSAVISSDQ